MMTTLLSPFQTVQQLNLLPDLLNESLTTTTMHNWSLCQCRNRQTNYRTNKKSHRQNPVGGIQLQRHSAVHMNVKSAREPLRLTNVLKTVTARCDRQRLVVVFIATLTATTKLLSVYTARLTTDVAANLQFYLQ